MKRAIQEYEITGIENTLSFGSFVLDHEAFVSGKFDTHFVSKYFTPDKLLKSLNNAEEKVAAAFISYLLKNKKTKLKTKENAASKSKWKERTKF